MCSLAKMDKCVIDYATCTLVTGLMLLKKLEVGSALSAVSSVFDWRDFREDHYISHHR